MATGFRKILEGLRLIPKAASTASEKGDLDVVTSSGKLNFHNGTTASPVVTEDHEATLTNKTLTSPVLNTPTADTITAIAGGSLIIQSDSAEIKLDGTSIDFYDSHAYIGKIDLAGGDMYVEANSDLQLASNGVVKIMNELSMQNQRIVNLATPTDSNDATTKAYVDTVNIVSLTAGENITAGDAVYVSTGTGADSARTAGRIYRLDAKNDDRVEFFGFANSTALSGAAVTIQVSGKRSGMSGLSVGKPVFASVAISGNQGAVQTIAPSAANEWVIPVGIAISTTELVVNGAGSATAVKITSEVVDNLYADVAATSANTILTNANSIVLATGGVSGITITLPTPAAGKIFNIKKIDAGLGAITIQTPSSQTIDGYTTTSLGSQYESVTITSNGTNFFII